MDLMCIDKDTNRIYFATLVFYETQDKKRHDYRFSSRYKKTYPTGLNRHVLCHQHNQKKKKKFIP